jgi:hypothetical protein
MALVASVAASLPQRTVIPSPYVCRASLKRKLFLATHDSARRQSKQS